MRSPSWFAFERAKPAAITGFALFIASYTADLILSRLGIEGAATLLNDLAIGILGALLLLFYLSASYEKASFERLKGRMAIVANLNRQMRDAAARIADSAMIEEREERLQQVDQAVLALDRVLEGLGTDVLGSLG